MFLLIRGRFGQESSSRDSQCLSFATNVENKRIATFMGSALAGVAFVTKLGGYFGTHCEHKRPCKRLKGGSNSTFNLVEWDDEEFFRIYGRPVYRYQTGFSDELLASQNVTEQEDAIFLLYTGNRWFGTVYKGVRNNTREYWDAYTREFHSFWEDAYAEVTRFVSDPTTGSSPIAVDFFLIGQRGEEFGPFGELFPLREPEGSGNYKCISSSYLTNEEA